MESIIQTFHIDWKLIIAQIVNFTIVVFVLWFFALKPLAQKMSERTQSIEKSLEEAKIISENMKKSEEEKAKIVHEARRESQKIIEESKFIALAEREKNIQETTSQVQKVVLDGKKQIAVEKEKMIEEVKNEALDLVILATSKILEEVVDKKVDQKLVHKVLKEARK